MRSAVSTAERDAARASSGSPGARATAGTARGHASAQARSSPSDPLPGEAPPGQDAASSTPGAEPTSTTQTPVRHRTERATLGSVAARAGVSRQTVSNVINSPDIVRPDTAERVRAAITELAYRPHPAAQQLRTRRSQLLGMRIYQAPDPTVFDRFLHTVTDVAATRDYRIMLYTADDDAREIDTYGRRASRSMEPGRADPVLHPCRRSPHRLSPRDRRPVRHLWPTMGCARDALPGLTWTAPPERVPPPNSRRIRSNIRLTSSSLERRSDARSSWRRIAQLRPRRSLPPPHRP